MLITLVSFKDKQLDTYTTPQGTDLKEYDEIIEDARRQIVQSSNRGVFKGKNLVKVGVWNSKTGTIDACDPEFLLNCDEVISECEDYERSQKQKD